MTTKQIVLALKWQGQAVAKLDAWARAQTIPAPDARRLANFRAGVNAGWNECVKTLSMHGWIPDKKVS